MSFAGGPLNNYVLQAMVRVVLDLRDGVDGDVALSTSVSGFLTKHGVGVWSTTPPPRAFVHEEVVDANASLPVDATLAGSARLVSSAVVHDRGIPGRAVAVVERDGVRSIVESTDPAVVERLLADPSIGDVVEVGPAGSLSLV
jgi:acetyl-CoA C-acetyltransferase